jgi:hypothetical protein
VRGVGRLEESRCARSTELACPEKKSVSIPVEWHQRLLTPEPGAPLPRSVRLNDDLVSPTSAVDAVTANFPTQPHLWHMRHHRASIPCWNDGPHRCRRNRIQQCRFTASAPASPRIVDAAEFDSRHLGQRRSGLRPNRQGP